MEHVFKCSNLYNYQDLDMYWCLYPDITWPYSDDVIYHRLNQNWAISHIKKSEAWVCLYPIRLLNLSYNYLVSLFTALTTDLCSNWCLQVHNWHWPIKIISIIWILLITYSVWSFPCNIRADSRFALSQFKMVLICNNVSHWLGTNLGSALSYSHLLRDKLFSDIIKRVWTRL